MSNQTPEYDELRRTVVHRLRRRFLFFANAGLWLLFTASMSPYVQTSLNGPRFSLLWFIIVIVHGFVAFDVWGRYVDRTVRKEMARRGMVEVNTPAQSMKSKRGLQLVDDGELADLETENEFESPAKRKLADSQ